MNTSIFLEKPQMAPITTPTVILIRAHMKAREMEIFAPLHTASKVELPEAPVPRIQCRL